MLLAAVKRIAQKMKSNSRHKLRMMAGMMWKRTDKLNALRQNNRQKKNGMKTK